MNSLSFLHEIHHQKILVAPLNWGLGHATRCIPIINQLLHSNHVIIASDGLSLSLLREQFPDLPYVELPTYNITYKGSSFMRSMLLQTPRITRAISEEMALAEDLVRKYKIQWIISDHRLGFRTSECKSVILVHQVQIQSGIGPLASIGSRLNKYFINQFDECWILDYKNRSLSLAGNLSLPNGLKRYKYIGPVSRLKNTTPKKSFDILIMLSGPEPSRSHLEDKLAKLLKNTGLTGVLVRGKRTGTIQLPTGFESTSLAVTEEIDTLMCSCRLVIARCGYTTVMDLIHTKKQAILIPTPGQTEQEYLAGYLNNRQLFHFIKQTDLNEHLITKIRQLLN